MAASYVMRSDGKWWSGKRTITAVLNAPTNRITRVGTQLYKNGTVFRTSGTNIHWLGLRETTLGYPTHAMIDEVLDHAVAIGAKMIRAHTLGISAGLVNSLITGINADGSLVWNNAAWEPIDYAIAGCRSRNIHLSIPFTDQFDYYHKGKAWWVQQAFINQASSGIPSTYTYNGTTETGVTSFTPGSNGTPSVANSPRYKIITQQFYRNTWIKNAFINNYVKVWFQHVNQYSLVANKDEPAVAAVQMGNEMWDSGDQYGDHAGADGIACVTQFSAAVKSVAPLCLVIDPLGADGVDNNYAPGRNDDNTDAMDNHLYNNHQPLPSGKVTAQAAVVNSFGKVAVFQEHPEGGTGAGSNIAVALSEFEQNAGIAFGLFWATYITSEGHSGNGVDDTVYTVGQNFDWKAQFSAHAAVMNGGTVPAAPPPPTNLLRSAITAGVEGSVSLYAAGSADAADPVLAVETTTGVSGTGALKVTATGTGHKWVYVNDLASMAPVTPGSVYTAAASVQLVSGSLGAGFSGHITWFTSTGSYISGATASSPIMASASYQYVTMSATAPANAAYATTQVEFDGPTSGTAVVRIDQFGVYAGSTGTPYTPPAT
jgi:hypothetical protein